MPHIQLIWENIFQSESHLKFWTVIRMNSMILWYILPRSSIFQLTDSRLKEVPTSWGYRRNPPGNWSIGWPPIAVIALVYHGGFLPASQKAGWIIRFREMKIFRTTISGRLNSPNPTRMRAIVEQSHMKLVSFFSNDNPPKNGSSTALSGIGNINIIFQLNCYVIGIPHFQTRPYGDFGFWKWQAMDWLTPVLSFFQKTGYHKTHYLTLSLIMLTILYFMFESRIHMFQCLRFEPSHFWLKQI